MISVVFMLWRDPKQRWREAYDYGIDHVNRAARMVRCNLKQPHRFVLFTDDTFKNVPWVLGEGDPWQVVPLNQHLLGYGHRWPKLSLFSPVTKEFGDKFLYFDLDMVVVGELDQLITDDDFRIVQQTIPLRGMHYNSSIMLYKPGTRRQIWDKFDHDRAMKLMQENGYQASDQYWIAHVLGDKEKTWGQSDGVYQFRDVMICKDDRPLPDNAKVVIFPGPYDPSMAGLQKAYPWIKEHWR